MATGGGPSKEGDYSVTWENSSSDEDGREQSDSATPSSANQLMDQYQGPDDLQDMSINGTPIDPDDGVSDSPSLTNSSESLSNLILPSIDKADINKTYRARPNNTSAPKSYKKNSKP